MIGPEEINALKRQPDREVAIANYLIQALEAARRMAREIARHPESCCIWIFGDTCDCGIGPQDVQCETPEGQ